MCHCWYVGYHMELLEVLKMNFGGLMGLDSFAIVVFVFVKEIRKVQYLQSRDS